MRNDVKRRCAIKRHYITKYDIFSYRLLSISNSDIKRSYDIKRLHKKAWYLFIQVSVHIAKWYQKTLRHYKDTMKNMFLHSHTKRCDIFSYILCRPHCIVQSDEQKKRRYAINTHYIQKYDVFSYRLLFILHSDINRRGEITRRGAIRRHYNQKMSAKVKYIDVISFQMYYAGLFSYCIVIQGGEDS